MRTIVADKVEQSQVREPVVLMIAVDMVDVDLVIHREKEAAMGAPSALIFEEFSSDCVEPDVLIPSCAPVAPISIIWTHSFAQGHVSFYGGIIMPDEAMSTSHDTVLVPTDWFKVFL